MVESLKVMVEQKRGLQEIPRVMEIVGPAGAGKTTLSRALNRYCECYHLSNFPDVRKVEDAPFFIWNGLKTISSLFPLLQQNGHQISRREFAWISILHGWPAILQKEKKAGNRTITLDQGPVYLIAEMQGFGSECLKSQKAVRMWQELYRRWAASLDLIVWLDTSDEILLERIHARSQGHIVKDVPQPIALDFLEHFRDIYKQVISELSSNAANLRVIRFDTGQERPDQIVARLSAEFCISFKTLI